MSPGASARLIVAAAALGLGAVPVLAHHSLALFNRTISRDIEGVVKEYKFANPHVRLTLVVANPDGSTTDWEFESTSVSRMIARGFNRVTARIGDTVTVHYNPMRSGKPGGFLSAMTDSRGRKYGPVEDR
jgi:uncharacterized protein DUF6152